MEDCFYNSMNELAKILLEYDGYIELEKMDKMEDIANYFKVVLKQRFVDYYDINLLRKLHDMILKLDCLPALVRLDVMMLDDCNNFDYKEILNDDISKNVIELVRKRLKLFVTDGLSYQLTIKDGCLAKPFEYNNETLNKFGRCIVKDTLRLINYLESCLRNAKLDINIIEKVYQSFTTEQLAFIYAQLQYYEYTNSSRFEYGSSDSYVNEEIERIFEVMWKRDDSEKIKFMRVICQLGYCNIAIGICAMLVELYKTMDYTSICKMLRNILSIRVCGVLGADIENDVEEFLSSSNKIKILRDEDIKNGCEIDNIYNYSVRATVKLNRVFYTK